MKQQRYNLKLRDMVKVFDGDIDGEIGILEMVDYDSELCLVNFGYVQYFIKFDNISKNVIEEKVYSSWANGDNEEDKSKINKLIYNLLIDKYKIAIDEDVNPADFDIIITSVNGYAHSLYKITKNTTNLTQDELALICDRGNLCFGYMMDWDKFHIFED